MEIKLNSNTDEPCEDCGYVDCRKKRFLDSKPQWVGDDGSIYRRLEIFCNEAARSLGKRYSELWNLASRIVEAGNDQYGTLIKFMNEHANTSEYVDSLITD